MLLKVNWLWIVSGRELEGVELLCEGVIVLKFGLWFVDVVDGYVEFVVSKLCIDFYFRCCLMCRLVVRFLVFGVLFSVVLIVMLLRWSCFCDEDL